MNRRGLIPTHPMRRAMSNILFLKGALQGRRLPLEPARTVLGRDRDCHVVLTSENAGGEAAVSRKHAIITREQDQYYIEDGDGNGKPSRNQTFVNDVAVPVRERLRLRDNDVIRICDSKFVFQDGTRVKPQTSDRRTAQAQPDEASSSIDASISHKSNLILAQPAEKLKLLLEITQRLSHTLELDSLLPNVVEALLPLFPQADRAFLILKDEATGGLVRRSFKTRRSEEDPPIGYRATIVEQCLKTVQGLLSHDPHPIMCAPLWREEDQPFGALVLDSHGLRRRFTEEDLNLLMGVATQASIALSNASFHRKALVQERLNRDLALAQEVVKSFLPKSLPDVPGYAFFANCEAAHEVGGDYYDLIPLAGQRLGILVGDVSGKGVAAALVMARFSAMAWACLRTESNLAAAVSQLNALMQPLSHTDRFVTLAALVLDPATQTVTIVNAGHPLPLLVRGGTGTVEKVIPAECGGLPLGIMAGSTYQAHQIALQPGDRVVLFSDGVTEAVDVNHHQLGPEGVRAVLEQAEGSPGELGERILEAVKTHAAGRSQQDDITLVCFGRTT